MNDVEDTDGDGCVSDDDNCNGNDDNVKNLRCQRYWKLSLARMPIPFKLIIMLASMLMRVFMLMLIFMVLSILRLILAPSLIAMLKIEMQTPIIQMLLL